MARDARPDAKAPAAEANAAAATSGPKGAASPTKPGSVAGSVGASGAGIGATAAALAGGGVRATATRLATGLAAKGEAAIAAARPRALPWGRLLVIFMRVVAVAWVAKGLVSWAAILGVGPWGAEGFEGRRLAWQAATVYFAVIDLVAAIGLWLASSWGAVIWLIAVLTELMLAQFFPSAFNVPWDRAAIYAALMLTHLVVAGLAAREQRSM